MFRNKSIILFSIICIGIIINAGCTKTGTVISPFQENSNAKKSNNRILENHNTESGYPSISLKAYTREKTEEYSQKWEKLRDGNWKEQLYSFINGKFSKLIAKWSSNGLRLIKYDLIDTVYNSNMYNYLLADPVFAPIYSTKQSPNKFSIEEILKRENLLRYIENIKKYQIKKYAKSGIILITLRWSYKGNYFNTQCLVSLQTNKIIYDDILTTIHEIDDIGNIKKKKGENLNRLYVPLVSTFSETSGHPAYFNSIGKVFNNWYGSATAAASITIEGIYINNLTSIDDYSIDATALSENPFVYVDAAYKLLGISYGTGGYVDYALGAVMGHSSVTLTLEGNKFSTSGGDMYHKSVGEHVTPDELNYVMYP